MAVKFGYHLEYAIADQKFSHAKAFVGDTVRLFMNDGSRIDGKIESLASGSIAVNGVKYPLGCVKGFDFIYKGQNYPR